MSKRQSNPKPKNAKKPAAPPGSPATGAKMLKTLAQHNAEINARNTAEQKARKDGKPNGLECPMCKAELRDTHPDETLTSLPPQKQVHCPACGWSGHRMC